MVPQPGPEEGRQTPPDGQTHRCVKPMSTNSNRQESFTALPPGAVQFSALNNDSHQRQLFAGMNHVPVVLSAVLKAVIFLLWEKWGPWDFLLQFLQWPLGTFGSLPYCHFGIQYYNTTMVNTRKLWKWALCDVTKATGSSLVSLLFHLESPTRDRSLKLDVWFCLEAVNRRPTVSFMEM